MSDAVKDKEIEIIDRGRGPQLSTSRITVLDLVHYFQDGFSHDEIIRWGHPCPRKGTGTFCFGAINMNKRARPLS